MTDVSAASRNYRAIGDVPFDVIHPMLLDAKSPMVATARETHEAAQPHTALFWAQARMENRWKTTGIIIKAHHNNPLSIRPPYHGQPGPHANGVITAPDGGQFETYASDADCAREWRRRLFDDPTYKSGIYASTTTLEEMLAVFAPGWDTHPVTGLPNADIAYLDTVMTMLRRFAEQEGGASSEDTNMATHRFVLSAGHRNTDRGGAWRGPESAWTYPISVKLKRAIERRGGSAWIIQEEDGDSDPTFSHGRGLQNVARLCVDLAKAVGGVDAYLSMHYGAEPVNGFFTIYPDAHSGADVAANNPLDIQLARTFAKHVRGTGMGIRGDGTMSERKSGVGLRGYRLGEFVGTINMRTTTARVIIEGGNSLSDAEYNRLWSNAWQDQYVEALVDGLEETFGAFGGARPQPGGLKVGDTVTVTERLNLRQGWGTDSPVMTVLDVGTEAEIIDGPRSANSHTWWDVKGVFGSGWVSGTYLEKTEKQPEPTPVPQYPAAQPIPALSGNRPYLVLDSGATFVRADLTVRATQETPRLMYADPDSEHIGPLINVGEQFSVDYICINPDGSLYWYTPWATRVAYGDTEIVQADVGTDAA